MKKLIVAVLVILLLFGGVLAWMQLKGMPTEAVVTPAENAAAQPAGDSVPDAPQNAEPAEEPAPAAAEEPEEEPEPLPVYFLDRDALLASHAPDEIVATVGGRDVRWDEYFYWLSGAATEVEDYINTMAMYGQEVGWDDPWQEGGEETFADYVVTSANESWRQVAAVENFAEANGIELGEEQLAEIEQSKRDAMTAALGEEATEEEFAEYLGGAYMSTALYDRLLRMGALYRAGFAEFYGEGGEKLDNDAVMTWLQEQGYVSANHILFMTVDATSGEKLSDEEIAQKLEKARAVAEELRAIEDPQDRLARFLELKEELDEDSGKASFPEGYTFTSGTMVQAFDKAARALQPYEISDPVETEYGYHVLIGLPLTPASMVMDPSTGAAQSAREAAANSAWPAKLDEEMAKTEFSFVPGFEAPDLLAYLKADED